MTHTADSRPDDRNDALDLEALAPDPATRDRVIAGALARLHAPETSGTRSDPIASVGVLSSAGRFAVPALLAAAAVAGLLLWSDAGAGPPAGDPSSDALLPGAPGTWSPWVAAGRAPAPEELIVLFAGGSAP